MKNLILFLFCAFALISCDKDSSDFNSNISGSGTAGSTATIITYNGFIYTVDGNHLRTLSLANPAKPVEVSSIFLGEGIETIFAYEDHLYLGTRSGILLYNISNGAAPVFTGDSFRLLDGHDPVVVNGNYAYSTTKWGEENNNPSGNLEVIDVSNKNNPFVVNQFNQEFPGGLALSDHILYVCNGKFGLNIFSTGPNGQLEFIKNVNTEAIYDCIPTDDLLICQSKTGLILFNISDRDNPVFIQKVNN